MKSFILLASTALVATIFAASDVDISASASFDPAVEDGSIAGVDDFNVLAFALTLEHLEAAFYTSAVKKFSATDFKDNNLYLNLQRVARDEQAHVNRLTRQLRQMKRNPPVQCQYKFPYNTSREFLELASVIEGVGVSAYAGAASSIRDPRVLTLAASILPVEARHDAVLRIATGLPPSASAFDIPLDFNQAWSLASQFIVEGSCPKDNTHLGLTAFPPLKVVKQDNSMASSLRPGTTVMLKANVNVSQPRSPRGSRSKRHASLHHQKRDATANGDRSVYAAFLTADGAIIRNTKRNNDAFAVEIPRGISGQVYVILSSSGNDVHDKTTLAGPAVIEIADDLK